MKPAIVMGVKFRPHSDPKWTIGSNDFSDYMARTGKYNDEGKTEEEQKPLETPEQAFDYYNYMSRNNIDESVNEIPAFIDYTKSQNKSSGIFDARSDLLTASDIDRYREAEQRFKDNGGVKYQAYLSFDNRFLKMNNIITDDNLLNVQELKDLTRSAVSTLISKSEKLDPSSLIWTAAIHMDKPSHIHIHVSIVKDGIDVGLDKLELSAINATKSKVVNRFIGHEDVKLLTKIERQELLPQLRDLISSDSEELIKLAKVLPPDRQWQYNRPKMKPFRKQIDDFTDRLIRNDPSLRDKYADYINLVDQRATKLKALYGEGEKKFYKNEKINRLAEFHARAGNSILQQINELYPILAGRAHLSEKERIDIATNDFSSSERYDEIDMTDETLSDIEESSTDLGDRAHLSEKETPSLLELLNDEFSDILSRSLNETQFKMPYKHKSKEISSEEFLAHLSEKEQFNSPSYIKDKTDAIFGAEMKKLHMSWNRAYKEACSLIYDNEPGSDQHKLAEKILLSEGAKGNILAISQLGTYYKDLDPELSHKFYAKALDSFLAIEPTSNKQRAYVQYRIGKAYCYGLGTDIDYQQAFEWFKRSSEANNKFAQYSLGTLYYNGTEVSQDYAMAMTYFQKAADKSQPYAAYMLGQMYAKGEGADRNLQLSNSYYHSALLGFEDLNAKEKADGNTYYKLARMYSKGLGTEINMQKAVKYWEKAYEQGNINAQYDYAKALMYGEGIEKDCDKAVELLKQAIYKGSINAKRLLANEYLTGEHLIPDTVLGIDLLKECAAEGDASSNYKLGKIFNEGLFGAEEDPTEAQKYFSCAFREYRKLEENKLTESTAFILGNMCEKGLGTEINIDAAIRYYSFSADNGNEFAQYAIGKIYLTEDRFNADQAEHYLLLASEQGNINAKRILANEYLTGEHLNRDAAHGIDLLKECAAEGDASSNYKLGKIFNEGLFGAEEDPAEAQKYFSCAFREYRKLEEENKLTESAAFILGNMCEKGLGTEINIDAAIKYYSFSADNGNEYAQYAVGRLYLTDDHFNAELAEKYLKLSAEQGNSYGQLGLGILYNRLGNKELSDYWIRQAADNGNEFAQKIIDSRLHPVEHSNQYQSAKSNLTGATFSALKQIYNKLNAQVNKLLAEAERDELIDSKVFRKY